MDNSSRRDLARTRRRILEAALTEFSAKGFSGARTNAITRRAGVNKRMLFYCFGSKEGLYREVLRIKLGGRASVLESTPRDFGAALLHWCEATGRDREWIRLQQWEALSRGKKLSAQRQRRELFERALAQFSRWVKQAHLPGGVDLRQLMISVAALAIFPVAFPQLTRLIAGVPADDPAFLGARRKFLTWLADRLCNPDALRTSAASAAGQLYPSRPNRKARSATDADIRPLPAQGALSGSVDDAPAQRTRRGRPSMIVAEKSKSFRG